MFSEFSHGHQAVTSSRAGSPEAVAAAGSVAGRRAAAVAGAVTAEATCDRRNGRMDFAICSSRSGRVFLTKSRV